MFDYGQKNSADQMRTSMEKLIQYVGTTYGQDISNELQNRTPVVLTEPTHSAVVTTRHTAREIMIRAAQANIQAARRAQEVILTAAVANQEADAPMKLTVLVNEIAQGDFDIGEPVPVVLTDSEKTQHSNEW